MNKFYEIMKAYTAGSISMEEANEQFVANGLGSRISYGRNGNKCLTDDNRKATFVNLEDGICRGFAMVDVGIGCLEKMEVVDGKLKYSIGAAEHTGFIGGHSFKITDGETLIFD